MSRVVRSYGWRERSPTVITGESMTEQSHRDVVNINNIMSRFHRTGELPPERGPRQYADVTPFQMSLRDRIETARSITELSEKVLADLQAAQAATSATSASAAAPAPAPAPSSPPAPVQP